MVIHYFTGLFMLIVLKVYKAYDIYQQESYSGHSLLFMAITNALATSLLFGISEFYGKPKFKIVTLKHNLLWTFGIIWIGTNFTYFLFNYFWSWPEFYWKSYLLFYYEYPLIVIFPIVIAYLIGKLYSRPGGINDDHLAFVSENEKNRFSVKPEHLLYLQASNNYVEIFYLLNSRVSKQLLRSSLKNINKAFSKNSSLVRCRQRFMVNPNVIDQIVKDSKSTYLVIRDVQVPISKKYLPYFKQMSFTT